MYPLLKGLTDEGLVTVKETGGSPGRKAYSLTSKGRRELERIRSTIAALGGKERVLGKLFAELLPSEEYVPIALRRMREGTLMIQRKVGELPKEERRATLEELRVLLGNLLRWVDSELKQSRN